MSWESEQHWAMPQDCDPLTHYIFHNYFHLLTQAEKLAYKSVVAELKARSSPSNVAAMLRRSWISKDPSVQKMLAEGPEAFFYAARDRVMAKQSANVHRIVARSAAR